MYSIRLERRWKCEKRGRVFMYEPATYRVPDDILESIAQEALRQKAAVKIMPKMETKVVEPVNVEIADVIVEAPRRRGRPRKLA